MADEPIPQGVRLVSNSLQLSDPFRSHGLQRRQRDHMSRQFTYVAHGTLSPVPPHEIEKGDPNFHVGTTRSAHVRLAQYGDHPRYSHIYRIHRDALAPVVFGDDLNRPESLDEPLQGIQQGLWEGIPHTSKEAEGFIKSSNLVLPYRNEQEDRGSVSFVVPKNRIGAGVEYLGRWNSHRAPTPEEDEAMAKFEASSGVNFKWNG